MRTVIGLFDDRNEAMQAYNALQADGFAPADLDILTNDDKDDEPKLAKMRKFVPEPDVTIYLEGVRQGSTIITANVADTQVSRAAEVMSGYNMVNVAQRATTLSAKAAAPLPELSDVAVNDNVIEVVEEDLVVGKESVERGRMRIYNVVTEREVTQNVGLRDETIRVTRRPVNRSVNLSDDLFKSKSFEMVEMDEIAKASKVARVVEEVYLGKEVAEKVETIKETLRRQDVQIEEFAAARPYGDYDAQFRSYYDSKLSKSGVSYEQLTPGLKFGYELATTEPFRSSTWSAVEADAMRIWEGKNPGTWDANKSVVHYAWETVRNAR